jgi:glycosyltransferase involved in cell wall biosynthesis
MTEKIKILLLLPTVDFSSPSNTAFYIAKKLDPSKFNVTLGSIRKANQEAKKRAENYHLKVVEFGMKSIFDIFVALRIYQFLKKEKIDVLHNFGFRPEIFGGLAGRLAKCQGILTTILHNPAIDIPLDYGKILGPMMNFLRKIASFYFEDVLVVLSKDAKEGLEKLGFEKSNIKIVYSGMEPKFLSEKIEIFSRNEVLEKFGILANKFVVGTIGVLKERKGPFYLIEAAKKVVEKYPDIVFLIIGKGPLEGKIRERIKSLNLEQYVFLRNYYERIAEIYKSIDLLVLPSITEGVPAVILEAMAFEIPIVATEVGGIPEMVEDGKSGILVPPKNSQALAEAIIKVYENQNFAKNLAKKAKENFEKYFTAEKMAKEYEKIYEELIY